MLMMLIKFNFVPQHFFRFFFLRIRIGIPLAISITKVMLCVLKIPTKFGVIPESFCQNRNFVQDQDQGPNSRVRSRYIRALETFEWSSRTKRKILILELVRHGVRTASRIRHTCSIAKSLFSLISQSTTQSDRKLDVSKNAEEKQENRIS